MIDQIFTIIGVTILVMISPGPDLIIVAKNTLTGSRKDGLATSLGVLSGNLIHIFYSVIGIGFIISKSVIAFNMLKFIGAIYLIYLGIKCFKAPKSLIEPEKFGSAPAKHNYFLQGFINNIFNPKGTLFYLGVFSVVIKPDTSLSHTIILITIMMAVSSIFWVLFVFTLDQAPIRTFMDKSQIVINRAFGGLLIILGIKVIFLEK